MEIWKCHVCNANLKGRQEVELLNPYEQGFGEDVRFKFSFLKNEEDYLEGWYNNPKVFKLVFELNPAADHDFLQKAKRNIDVFHLEPLYNTHKDHVLDLLLTARIYNSSKIDSLLADFPDLFPTRESLLKMITSNQVSLDDLGKRVLAKLYRDISRDFGIR